MSKLYYTPPSDKLFLELKCAAIDVWREVGSDPSYIHEKVSYIDKMTNVGDNFMTIFALFDMHNQRRCGEKLSKECKDAINEQLIDGGSPEYLLI